MNAAEIDLTKHCAHGVRVDQPCWLCSRVQVINGKPVTAQDKYLEAAQDVASARVAESEAFLRFKGLRKDVTDRHAQAQAIVETGSALDVALAKLELARRSLGTN
jgi:hypothetical protein